MKTFTNLAHRAFKKCASLGTINKKRYYLFIITMLLTLGVGNAWAEEVTFSFKTIAPQTSGTTGGISWETGKTGSANNTICNATNGLVLYGVTNGGGYFQTTSPTSGVITNVNIVASPKKNTPKYTIYGSTDGNTWTAIESDITISTNNTTKDHAITGSYTYFKIANTTAATAQLAITTLTITYETGGGETPEPDPDPTPDPEPEPGTGGTGTINFNNNAVKINAASVTGKDNLNNTWTITTVGTTSYTANSAYYQVGKSDNPATSITFTTTLPSEGNITAFSAKFGGFNGTAGTVTLKVDDTSVGTGSLNASNDVTVSNSSQATGKKLTVTVTGIARGVKVYYISYTYTTSSGGSEPETPATELTDAQFAWSAATAEATMGASNTFPTLTNTLPVSVTYESSNTAAATITADGTITLVAPGTTTISAIFAGGEVSGTTYAPKTVTYALTVLKAPATLTDNVYVKVTTTAGITDGEYLIVYEDETAPVAFNGALATLDAAKNTVAVGISNSTIAGNTDIDAALFTIDVTAGTLKSASGKYIGVSSNSNGLKTEDVAKDYKNAFSVDNNGNAVITADFEGSTMSLRYNKTNDANSLRFRYYKNAGQQPIALYKKASKHTVTIADCTNGSVSAKMGETALATNDQVLSGIQITLSNETATNYKLTAYDVYKTGEESTKVTVTDGKFIMPEFDVTISATFVPAKTLTSIEITTPATQTTFWQGETFNYEGLEVTAHFDGAAGEDVTDKVTVTGSTDADGTQTVEVSFTEGSTTKTTNYNITVKAIPNTKETAYSVADAYDIIDKLTTAEGVFISGTISQVDSYNDQYKSITYWISADGTTTKQLQVYSGKGLESADFSGKTDLSVGDQVIVCGDLKKHNTTYEFDYNNYLAAYTPTTKDPAGLAYATTEYTANVGEAFTTPELTNPHNLVVTYSTSDASKATVDANTGAVTIVAAGEVTITASTKGDATHDAGSASYTITISNPAMAVATLPFAFDNGKADIENTPGMSQGGLGSDYTSAGSPKLKFDHTGDYVIIHFNGEPGKLSYDIKGNGYSGGTFTVQESADGSAYTNVVEYTELGSTETKTHTLDATSRYVKFIYTNKSEGNVALGNIKIALPEEEPEQPGDDPVVPTPTVNPTATFIFNTAEGLNDLGITYPETADTDGAYKTEFENNATFTQDGITMTTTGGTTMATRVWLNAAKKLDLRVYKGATLTFSVPENLQITTIAFNGSNINHLLVDGVAVNNNTWTGSKQEITFTAREDASTIKINTIDFVVSYTRTVPVGYYATICVPNNIVKVVGATLYKVAGKENGKLYFDEVLVEETEEGKPYVFFTELETQEFYFGTKTTSTAGKENSLQGTFVRLADGDLDGDYMLQSNQIIRCAPTGCWIDPYRAYFDGDDLRNNLGKPGAQMPGRRRVSMGAEEENETTGTENIVAPEGQTLKLIENGQLIIIRGGEKFNAQGVRL